jgi:hypothetical protein
VGPVGPGAPLPPGIELIKEVTYPMLAAPATSLTVSTILPVLPATLFTGAVLTTTVPFAILAKLRLILSNAILNGSPVWSLAEVPMYTFAKLLIKIPYYRVFMASRRRLVTPWLAGTMQN